MQGDDPQFEKYLSEFKPSKVRPLQVELPEENASIRWLAAAALLLFSIAGGLWYARHETKHRAAVNNRTVNLEVYTGVRSFNPILLTKLALENDAQFGLELEAQSSRVLPDFRGKQSTLQVFAKE
jgi:hypothetical protein